MGLNFKKISIAQVKLKKAGDKIEGYIRQINPVQMAKGPATELVVESEDGVVSSAILGVAAAKAINLRTVGEYVRVTLTGSENTQGGNRVNLYDVEVAEDDGK
jgi:hypothetical protein